MAGVFAERGASALVFRGSERGLDELTTVEPSQVWSVAGGVVEYTEFDAVEAFDGRLPELFCGFARSELATPVPYPTSCSPQA